jgi:hypothetical protein
MKPTQSSSVQTVAAGATANRATRMKTGAGTLGELYKALVGNGRWWMVPMIAILGVTSLLLVAIAAVEYVAPFVYTIF